ncbi:nuclear transport factor 2 family protein [Mesorhizobium sp. GbtcB19]|uniref:nuclear transport factor 2 family protein n=1 Tax=Mesorhizobium sp. GbtcB19 TaxID=2824764 RepID=UPI001C3117A3|nr:nuclear transport factor 2 family protein [Mesorhizobium sp. GbtcB19]
MSNNLSPALHIALAYYDAWRNHDHATAMKVVAEDVVSETPFGSIVGATALHKSESEFAGMLKGATIVASFGDETTALLMYYTHTHPVPSTLSAKYFTVENGKVTAIKALFDKSVFAIQ